MSSGAIHPSPASDKEVRTILVVEDKVELRYTLAEWLRIEGYIVLEASSADDAMTLLHSPLKIDLVVTDVHMPGSMNGLALSRHIHAVFPAIKVIIVSGDADRASMPQGIVFFSKPYNLNQITQSIARIFPEHKSGIV